MDCSRRTLLAFLAPCFLIGCSSAFAQNGTIHGVVLDPQAAAVSGARVTAFDEAKGQVIRETVTAADGAFQLLPLPRGTYTVKIEMSGFKTTERTQLTLDPNQIMNLGAITLELGQTAESVTIQAEVPLVETTTANKSFVLSSRQVTELSINGRDFQNLMLTLPGVVSNNASSFRLAFNSTDQFNVNGMRGSANNFFLDGSINTDVGANDGQYTQLSMDAVGEFKVQTSVFSAELGRNPGILLSATTKSGGQEFHGTVYEFLRNNVLDARLPLDRTGKVADLRFNQFGGNLGGPVILPKISPANNKKVFFFFNYEGTRASRPRGSNFRDLPHPDLLTGDLSRLLRPQRMQFAPNFNVGTVFQPGTITRDSAGRVTGGLPFPNNIVPRSMWSRNAEAFLRVIGSFPTAGGTVLPSSPELIRVPYQEIYRFYKNQYVARIDYSISPKANFFFRWVRDDQNEEQPTGIFTSAPFPVFPQFREKPGRSFSWNLVNVISPSMTNEVIVTYNDLDQLVDVTPGTDSSMYDKDALGFRIQELYPQVNVRNRFPRFSCGVGNCNFSNFPANWRSEATTYAFTDNFTVVRRSHTFKFGTLINRNDNAQQPSWTDALNVSFSPSFINPNDTDQTFANMLLGNYTSINQSDGIYYGRFRFFGMEFYGQDSWKVNRRVTLELGARYVYLGPTCTLGKFLMYYFDPARYDPSQAVQIETARGATQGSIIPGSGDPFNGMVQEGSPGVPKGFSKHRWNQVSPRFGIAIDPFGDGKTSIRAGGGIFWERIRQNNPNFDGLGNPPLAFNPSIFAGKIDDVSPALLAGGVRFPQGIRAWSGEGKNPTIYSWSVNIQRQLPGQTSVDIGYIGNLGRHLMDVRDINQLPLGTTINTPILSDANGVANAV